MHKLPILLALAVVFAATAVLAQPAPSPVPPFGDRQNENPRMPDRGPPPPPHGDAHFGGRGFQGPPPPPPPPPRGAVIRISDGTHDIHIKCADDDGTKACVEAILPVIERALQPR